MNSDFGMCFIKTLKLEIEINLNRESIYFEMIQCISCPKLEVCGQYRGVDEGWGLHPDCCLP